jgi:N utilization substance protein A
VAPDQFSLAIGRNGQNVRLASELTGWKIKVKEDGGGQEFSGEAQDTEEGVEKNPVAEEEKITEEPILNQVPLEKTKQEPIEETTKE